MAVLYPNRCYNLACKKRDHTVFVKYISPIQPQAFGSKNFNQLICIKEISLIFCREILPPYTAEPYPINPYSLQDVNGNAQNLKL